jgi:hypothetical protein
MADDYISNGIGSIWSAILTGGIAFVGYLGKRRDDAIVKNSDAMTALELKVAEYYATKENLRSLVTETNRINTENTARVEKRIDETNISVGKTNDKVDKVLESLGNFKDVVMLELNKKT